MQNNKKKQVKFNLFTGNEQALEGDKAERFGQIGKLLDLKSNFSRKYQIVICEEPQPILMFSP